MLRLQFGSIHLTTDSLIPLFVIFRRHSLVDRIFNDKFREVQIARLDGIKRKRTKRSRARLHQRRVLAFVGQK